MTQKIIAGEVMIGNYVDVGRVIDISEHRIIVIRSEITSLIEGFPQVYGIPLTEDWLLKFGFVKNNRHYTKDMYDDKTMAFYYPAEEYKEGDEYEVQLYGEVFSQITVDVFYVRNTAIQYVHQLQNLFFALTGTHLTLTQKPE